MVRTGNPARTSRKIISALDEKHNVPLFFGIAAQREILRLLDEQTAHPIFGLRSFRDTWRMNVKPFCRLREHPGIRPLRVPKPDPLKDAFVAPDKFAEDATMTLMMNLSRENLHARDSGIAHVRRSVVARHQRLLRVRGESLPKLFVLRRHLKS
ncbi:MAG: hypothetical protein DME70_07010 [Verrucomicrobia bacterium]|nr:MAG: hypothetical protein DME70_07010 [Verrucomicrobiota bacterium]